jgi:protocatechuate 3,4-dioxygenase alpha subunit
MELPLTPSQTVGPFFHLCLTTDESAAYLRGPELKGERIQLRCRVFDGDGVPVDDAMIEFWQAHADGVYGHFGRLATNAEGACVFETVKPGRDAMSQAPHINVSIFARGLLRRVVTRIYFEADAANHQDSVLALVPERRRETLMARQDPLHPGRWTFEIRLCGDRETVFFDV